VRQLQISAILLGGILLAPFQPAQEVAYAIESKPGYVVFSSNGPAHFTSVSSEASRWRRKMLTGPPASSALWDPLFTPRW
jgi:hypothetical protein